MFRKREAIDMLKAIVKVSNKEYQRVAVMYNTLDHFIQLKTSVLDFLSAATIEFEYNVQAKEIKFKNGSSIQFIAWQHSERQLNGKSISSFVNTDNIEEIDWLPLVIDEIAPKPMDLEQWAQALKTIEDTKKLRRQYLESQEFQLKDPPK